MSPDFIEGNTVIRFWNLPNFKEEQRNLSEEGKRLRSELEQHRIDKENLGQGKFEQDRNMSKMQVRMI